MASRSTILAGNWKMNHGPRAARSFFEEFARLCEPRADRRVVFFPPAISIPAALEATVGRTDIEIGIQNIHWENAGAFTGEISAGMAAEAGVHIALVGHSERRHVFAESDEQVGWKAAAAIGAGLDVIICVGETLEEREAGQLDAVLSRQVSAALATLSDRVSDRLAIAYEPVWAIGTGVNATPADAAAAHATVRELLAVQLGPEAADRCPILYGGSVNAGNAANLLAATDVDGVLVGGASLKPESFAAIVGQGIASR
jgi:triosephosphate isomerase (TIM)